MPASSRAKGTSARAANTTSVAKNSSPKEYAFPFLQYASLLGTSTVLVLFSALAPPTSSKWLGFRPLPQNTSLDRPQLAFLNPFTANPTGTIVSVCIGVALVMVWWASWVRQWWQDEKRVKRIENSTERAGEKILTMRRAGIWTVIGSVLIYGALILFGAPLFNLVPQTLSLALLLSFLCLYTPLYALPNPAFESSLRQFKILSSLLPKTSSDQASDELVNQLTWLRIFSEGNVQTPVERIVLYPFIGTLAGCWLGVIPIALDWDRPWQAWPLTPAYGAIAGYVIAGGVAFVRNALGELVQLGANAPGTESTNKDARKTKSE
ncbi:hypothetical protein DL93DRAFT_2092708 [Clavulina sp. PMI_390]|nr:hypothetical protein DL93DRAFT_2092708 [Clavulina sp. PMI_390]